MQAVIWGAGKMAREFAEEYKYKKDIYEDCFICCVDSNDKLWGRETEFGLIKSPDSLFNYDADIIVIACNYYNEVKRELMKKYNVEKEKIYFLDEYKKKCTAQFRYQCRYRNKDNCVCGKVFDEKIIVYTSITGEYDFLNDPLYVDDGITYVCFTNNHNIKSKVWNVEYIKNSGMDDMHLAKKIKLMPDIYCKEFETSVWVDGKYLIKNDLRKYISEYQRQMPMLCFPHPVRWCIYDEAAACIWLKRGKKREIIPQIAAYYREKFPYDNGLYEMGCIVRKHNDDKVIKLMRDWWEEISKYSYRDQISFPYVCRKNNFVPDICSLDINKNLWLEMVR